MTLAPLSLPDVHDTPAPPPPPHDPRDRELLTRLDDWEIRAFGSRWFAFFAPRGLWHVQLWHPEKRLSIITPSTLTRGSYELSSSSSAGAPTRSTTYAAMARVASGAHGVTALTGPQVAWIESVFVRRVIDPGPVRH